MCQQNKKHIKCEKNPHPSRICKPNSRAPAAALPMSPTNDTCVIARPCVAHTLKVITTHIPLCISAHDARARQSSDADGPAASLPSIRFRRESMPSAGPLVASGPLSEICSFAFET